MTLRFSPLRTAFYCPDCNELVSLALAIQGLHVTLLRDESIREFERHVLSRPDRHPTYAFPVGPS